MSDRRELDHRCRHHEGPKPGPSSSAWGTCTAGEDPKARVGDIAPEDRARLGCFPRASPCVRGLRGGLECPSYEPYTEAEIVADEAETAEALRRSFAGLSPCCGVAVVKRESERTTVAHCPACGEFAYRTCRRIGEPS